MVVCCICKKEEGKLKIKDLIGPDFHSTPDDKGRLPGDAHYNHGH